MTDDESRTVDTAREARLLDILTIEEGTLGVLLPRQQRQLKPFLRKALKEERNEAYQEAADMVQDEADRVRGTPKTWEPDEVAGLLEDLRSDIETEQEEVEDDPDAPSGY